MTSGLASCEMECLLASTGSYAESRLMVLAAWFGPRHPKGSSSLLSSAFVARKKCSSSSRADPGHKHTIVPRTPIIANG